MNSMSFVKRARHFFLTTILGGLLVILPLTIVFILVRLVFRFTFNLIQPLTNLIDIHKDLNEFLASLIAFGVVIAFFFFVGLFIETQLGKRIWHQIESQWLGKLPMYNIIKETVQQFSGQKEMPFRKVVLVDPFNTGAKMTGFITDETDGIYTVFVPTAPNPTNGFVFHMPANQVELLNVETDKALRSIIAIGVGSQDVLNAPRKSNTQSTATSTVNEMDEVER
mgnify:FL=1